MRLHLLTASLLLAFSLACSGIVPPPADPDQSSTDGTTTDGTTTPDAASTEGEGEAPTSLPEPWKSMMLPVGDGEIVEATTDAALVSYPAESLLTLTNTWTGALINAGFTQVQDVSKPGITALIFQRAQTQVGLVTAQEEGVNFAYVEDLGRVKHSMVRGQRGAGLKGHPGGRMRRAGGGPKRQ